MKAVVLAAGKGSRLFPVTKAVAKPLLPLANRMTIEYAFDQLRLCGIEDVCIVVGENEDEIRESLGNGTKFDVSLSYARQSHPLGLANAVSAARDFIGNDDFVLYLGDAVYGASLEPAVRLFKETGASNVNLVKEVEDPRRFGVANLDGNRITRLVEKPQNPESNFAMAGFYIFSKDLWEVMPELRPSARGEYEITDAIQLMVERNMAVLASVYEHAWFDTGTLDSFLATSQYLTKGENLIHPTARISGKVGEGVVVGEGAIVHCAKMSDAVVLPNTTVKLTGELQHALVGGEVHDVEIVGQVRYGAFK